MVGLLEILDADLVDERVSILLLNDHLCFVALVGATIVLLDSLQYGRHSFLYLPGIIMAQYRARRKSNTLPSGYIS